MNFGRIIQEIRQRKVTKERILHLCIGIGAVLIYEFFARPVYRPYIYEHAIDDFHIADTIGNTLGTVATVFVLLALFGKGRREDIFVINATVIGVAVYELAHPLLGKPVDPWDVGATIISGLVCRIVYTLLPKLNG